MQKPKNSMKTLFYLDKKNIVAASLILIMAFGVFVAVSPLSKADTLYSHSTYIWVTAAPNPVGVNQTTYVSFIIANVPPAVLPTSLPKFFYWSGITLTVTTPDGTIANMTNLQTSYAGAGTITYVPTETGNYTFVATFPGETIPSGPVAGQVYGPSTSTSATLTVSNMPATSLSYPLSSSYWTYPVEAENEAWSIYTGNWLAGNLVNASAPCVWNPYTVGPASAHVMWSQPWITGGLTGGSYNSQLYANGRWPGGGDNYFCPFIANGIMYVNMPEMYTPQFFVSGGGEAQAAGFEAINLATGKVLWTQTAYNDTISYLEVLSYPTSTMEAATVPLLWSCNSTGGTWRTYDPMTGNLVQAITGVPSGGRVTFGPNSELMVYFLNANGWMAAWNSTYFEGAAAQIDGWINGPQNAPNTVYITPQGTYNFSIGYQWNITIPKQAGIGFFTNNFPSILPNDLMIIGSTLAPTNTTGSILELMGISILPNQYTSAATNVVGSGAIQAYTGNQAAQVLFGPENITVFMDEGAGTYATVNSIGIANNGVPVFVIFENYLLATSAYNAQTGAFMYTTQPMASGLSTYDGESNNVMCADGKLFQCGYDGMMYCYDLATGNLLWTYYCGNAGLNTAYGSWPIEGSYAYFTVAGGMVVMSNNEHSPADPTWLGGQVFAVNETNGNLLWTIDSVQWDDQPLAVAEGQALYLNFYDGQLYDLGKGPSATTVSAPQTSIATGQTMTITGTVMDVSPGSKQTQQAADFPNGLPCVSDASMSAWMNYVYMQKPMPTNASGVQVTLTAVDPNHNTIPIGTATTDTSGNYAYIWNIPNIAGPYQIVATFSGTNSYWGSSDTAYLNTIEPTGTVTPTSTPTSVADLYFVPAIAGLFAAVIIIGVVLVLLMLRKRP